MSREHRLYRVALALLASALIPSLSSAEVTYRYRSAGASAMASFYALDSTGCTFLETFLEVTEKRVQTGPGPATPSTWVDFYGYHLDICSGEYWFKAYYGSQPIPDSDFHSAGLQSASLQTTFNVLGSDGYLPVTVDLVWTPEGEVWGGKRTWVERYEQPDWLFLHRYRGSMRVAIPSGSIVLGPYELAAPGPVPAYGEVRLTREAETTIVQRRPN